MSINKFFVPSDGNPNVTLAGLKARLGQEVVVNAERLAVVRPVSLFDLLADGTS